MLYRRLVRADRIAALRPLRPPGRQQLLSSPRAFTQKSQLLLVGHRALRPQLPYLAQPGYQGGLQKQLSRFLSTESRNFVRETAILSTKAAAIAIFLGICGVLINTGLRIEGDERRDPTPTEWRFWTREHLRRARALVDTERNGRAIVDWAAAGSLMLNCLTRLEDAENEGKGLGHFTAIEGDLGHRGIPWGGYDISQKSYEWRTCYFEICMASATAAEHMENMVRDTTRRLVFPKEVVIGPSNPDPRPTPSYMATAPLEENCEPAFASPELFYTRILTGTGFTTKQRLDATGAYATWLEYKGLTDRAEEQYKSAVEISKSALAASADAVIDSQTFVLKDSKRCDASENLLRATTNLAAFYARTADVSSALPIFLSVLRTRRTARGHTHDSTTANTTSITDHESSSSSSDGAIESVKSFFRGPEFPMAPESGNAPFVPSSASPTCDESELMLYIGEILFASGTQIDEGVAWTRQGVTIADANLEELEKTLGSERPPPQKISDLIFGGSAPPPKNQQRERCKDCLFTGVQNWELMLMKMLEQSNNLSTPSSTSWFGWTSQSRGSTKSTADLDEELSRVAVLKNKIVKEGIAREMYKVKGQTGGMWIG